MKVVFLGTGGAGGPPGRAHNCILVESRDGRILLDAGEGCSWRLEEYGVGLCDIDLVYVSHLHVDHYIGLFDAVVRGLARGCRRLVLGMAEPIASSGGFDAVLSMLPSSIRSEARLVALPSDRGVDVAGLNIRLTPSCHAVDCYGVVVSDGVSSLLYTSDTRWRCPGIEEYAGSVDLVIHEAALPSGLEELAWSKGHTTVSQLVELARQWRETRVVAVHLTIESLVHFQRIIDMPGNLSVASDHYIMGL